MNEILVIENVRGYVDENGNAWLNAEDVARGFGFVQSKGNVEYIRWDTVNGYLRGFGFSQHVGKTDFLPENMVYRLGFKASNETAQAFQAKLADDIIPSIRKTGSYHFPQSYPEALRALADKAEENERLLLKTAAQEQEINELRPKADYTDEILKSHGAMTITQIAKDYGMSGQKMNQILKDHKVQYSQSGQWLLYSKYQSNGYTKSETVSIERRDGTPDFSINTKWTQKGRLFLYNFLKQRGILPLIERERDAENELHHN